VIAVLALMIAGSLIISGGYSSFADALLGSSFQTISFLTTTGFGQSDTATWPMMAGALLMFAAIHCGCSGSTTGGIKVDRLLISFKAIVNEVKRRLHPTSFSHVKMSGHHLADNTVSAVMLYIVLYVFVIFVSIVAVMLCGTDPADAVTGVIASVGSVGPGIGELGSLDNYSAQLTMAKVIYSFDMFLGRLEIFPILIVISLLFKRDK
jgi:trk system potassium uptake protein TrkH